MPLPVFYFHPLRIRLRRMVFFRRFLDAEVGDPPAPVDGARVEEIDAAAAGAIRDYEDKLHTQGQILRRLAAAERLFAVRVGQEIASFAWIRAGAILVPALDQDFMFPPRTVHIMGVYTKPAWRNKGLAKYNYVQILRRLRGEGVCAVFLEIDRDNEPSMCAARAVGFQEYLRATYLRLAPLRLYWLDAGGRRDFLFRFSKRPSARADALFYSDYL
jgi:ribosomal protein S18 acetylase RimI-like enzyme